jgi:hypothetical protein
LAEVVDGVFGEDAAFDIAKGLEAGRAAVVASALPGWAKRLHLGVAEGGIEEGGVEAFEVVEGAGGEMFFIGVAAEGVEGRGAEVELSEEGEEGVVGGWLVDFWINGFLD